jgi:hypothetical protein
VTVTGPAASAAFSDSPAVLPTARPGMLAAALPPNARGSSPAGSSMMMPTAPAAFALLTVASEPHYSHDDFAARLHGTVLPCKNSPWIRG